MLAIIEKYGFYLLTLLPTGLAIVIGALYYSILGMGLIGVLVMVFGFLNKCLLLGQCEIKEPQTANHKTPLPKP